MRKKLRWRKVRARRQARATEMRVIAANLNYNTPGDRLYLKFLKHTLGTGVLFLQELVRGLKGTRVRGVRWNVSKKRWRALGRIGAHRGVAVGTTLLAGEEILLLSIHALHVRTVGAKSQEEFYEILTEWLESLTLRGKLWILAGDLNRPYAGVGRMIGAADIVGSKVLGIAVSPGLRIIRHRVITEGEDAGWTDHSALLATIALDEAA